MSMRWLWTCKVIVAGLHLPEPPEHDDVPAKELGQRPFCPRSPKPPVAGYLSEDNLVLEEPCRYSLFESPDAARCLQGGWLLVMGSSNSLLQFNNLVDFLAPEEYFNDRKGELIGVSAVVDVIISDQKVVHWKQMDANTHACQQLNMELADARRPDCQVEIGKLFADAPAHGPGSIRITFITAFFWYRADLAMEVAAADPAWKNAELGVVAQIGAWYMYCMIIKFKWCPRKELIPVDFYSKGMTIYKAELTTTLSKMEAFCAGSRTGRLGCSLQTVSWSNGARDNKAYKAMNVHIREQMATRATETFQMVDFWNLGRVMPQEVVEGHGSPILNLWIWTVMFNSMCPLESANAFSHAVFKGSMCSASELTYSKCPQYQELCKYNTEKFGGPICMNWQCMNSVPCNLSAVAARKPPEGLCEDAMNISGPDPASEDCDRLWCRPDLEWLPTLVIATIAVAVKLIQHLLRHPLPAAEPVQAAPAVEATKPAASNTRAVLVESEIRADEAPLLEPPADPPSKRASAVDVRPFGLALFLGASHLVLNELFNRGSVEPLGIFALGYLWAPWFFMVRGFQMLTTELDLQKEESFLEYIARYFRFYPLYAVGLVFAFILTKTTSGSTDLGSLIAQSFLLQTWWPAWEAMVQPQCWFFSCFCIYGLLFKPLARLRDANLATISIFIISFMCIPWLAWGIHSLPGQEMGPFYQSDLQVDLGPDWQHHPLCYLHVFVLGMLLAKLRQLLDEAARCKDGRVPFQRIFQCLAPLGYAGILIFSEVPWIYQLILPFQAMIVLGLAGLPCLPLPFLPEAFARLDFLEDYYLAICIFSYPLYLLWPCAQVTLAFYLLSLYALAFIMVTCVERPLLSHWPPKAWPLVPCVLAVALAVASLPSPPPAPHVHVSPGLLDVALPLARPALHVADEVLLVATRQAVVRRRGNGLDAGWPAVIVDEVVHSEILVGRQALNASAWRDWPKTGESPLGAFHFEPWTPRDAGDLWEQCPTEHWFPANRSLLRRWTGPSQPQIFHHNGLKIAFSSQPRSKELGGCLMGSPMQNYLSSLDGSTPATRVDFGVFNEAERSWIPFVHNGVVRFVYSLLPHVIISAQGQRLHSTSFPPLHRLRHELPDLEIHGAGTAVPMDPGADDGQPYYLALLYIAGGGKVTSHFYRFGAQAPFEVLQVSSPLPLMPRSVVTGLARHHDSLLVSYGTGNEGRALVMTLEKMNDLFHCSSLSRS